jgi:hypothetical protein
MKFLVLAFGDEKDWIALSKEEQDALLAQDDVLRQRGDFVAALGPATTVTAWDGKAKLTDRPIAHSSVPLAGFGVIDADDLEHAIELVTNTPCARAKGYVELRPLR